MLKVQKYVSESGRRSISECSGQLTLKIQTGDLLSDLLTLCSCSLGLQRSFCNSSWKQSLCQGLNSVRVLKNLTMGRSRPFTCVSLYVINTGHELYALKLTLVKVLSTTARSRGIDFVCNANAFWFAGASWSRVLQGWAMPDGHPPCITSVVEQDGLGWLRDFMAYLQAWSCFLLGLLF